MSRPKLVEPWTAARINHLSAEADRLEAGPIARLFLKKARVRYRLYCSRQWLRDQHLCWNYLDAVAGQLLGRVAPNQPEGPDR